jgi:1,4-alpha-glucan branching enzyme
MDEAVPKEGTKNRWVTFRLNAPSVKEVILMGDFNNWDARSHPMQKDENGIWNLSIELPPGKYEYRLLVDGQWRLDSGNNQTVPNCFGTENNVLIVFDK